MMITREDHVSIIMFPDETKVVEHEDGTRITTFLKDLDSTDRKQDEKSGETFELVHEKSPLDTSLKAAEDVFFY